MAFGTEFTLNTQAERNSTTVLEFGEDQLWENLRAYWAAHNILFNQAAEFISERTTDRQRVFGGTDDAEMQELDEFGQPSAQTTGIDGYNVGFPLRRFGAAIQWTRFAFENMTVTEFANKVNAITDADERNLYRSLRQALFSPTNSTFRDWMQMPKLTLAVKALVNGDGQPIPDGPYGKTFDGSTHTHYLGVTTANTPTQGDAERLITTVQEHYTDGQMYVYINSAEESDVRGFADFKPYLDARLVNQSAAVVATGTLNVANFYDRAIGLLAGAEVWVKPWIPAGYMLAFNAGQIKPLVLRQPIPTAARDLRLVAQDENYPLRANEWEHRFGLGVWHRTSAAILDTVTGGGTYTAPTV